MSDCERSHMVHVAVPLPLARLFAYQASEPLPPGVRVRVPFGARVLTGLVMSADGAEPSDRALRAVIECLDSAPLFTEEYLRFLMFVADYYHHPVGEVVFAALPPALKGNRDPGDRLRPAGLALTAAGQSFDPVHFGRAERKRRLFAAVREHEILTPATLGALGAGFARVAKDLVDAGLLARVPVPALSCAGTPGPALRDDQRSAIESIRAAQGFAPFLLFGVTGSGKTEVYLRVIEEVVRGGRQALVLVPEIGLTPQLVARFAERLGSAPGVLHSGCTPTERARVWRAAQTGHAPVVVGTRSAVFVPLKAPGIIVVDEEHDPSFKQQDGFRYHARDVAVLRGQRAGVPVLLGSATPSLESYRHARAGRYTLLRLPDRGAGRVQPAVRLIDLGAEPAADGLSPSLVRAVGDTLRRHEQALLFLNRRGFSPVLLCRDCRWHAPCDHCDARLTVHAARQQLRCHHCGHEGPLPATCPQCGGSHLMRVGEGTERIEEALRRTFPSARIARVDRDSMTARDTFTEVVRRVQAGEVDILVGTQMLAKGHDFPRLTLAAVVNADQGLYGSDFRADEQLFAQIMQVAGRSGRADLPGEVWIQTHHPSHPLWQPLTQLDYEGFAEFALRDRELTGFPPYAFCALLRAEARDAQGAQTFLRRILSLRPLPPGLTAGAVLPANMARRAGFYRAQCLLSAERRAVLHAWLRDWLPQVHGLPQARRVRWSVDVDPYSLFF
ncbi:MAG: primosomal protein N' [Gammaproteobacteria bacterium]|nr:primosomal protein N' [Gammaproteobacteria bacterium]